MLFKIIATSILLCFIAPQTEAKYAAECMTPLDDPGVCVPIKSCAGAYNLLLNILKFGENDFKSGIAFIQQSQCDYVNETPFICCPSDNIIINPVVYEHLKKINCGYSGTTKISNGEKAGLYDYRWMALLKYDGKVQFACGGSLIDDRHVLTAAHCLHNFTNLPLAVRLGEYDLSNETDCVHYGRFFKCLEPVQDIGIEKIIPHEDYVYQSIHHDIAILRLERPVKFTKHIRPICLPISETMQTAKIEDFLIAGWGRTEKESRSNILLWTSVPYRPNDFCQEKLGVTLSNEHICAGGRRYQDTCKGDSGGPLFYFDTYVDGVDRAIQYGIVSFGASSCGDMNVPAVYVNVTQYLQWITDHIQVEADLV